MPIFMIERRYAEQLDADEARVAEINQINAEEGVRWLTSFLSLDERKTFCLYESPSAEAIHSAARRAGLPADAPQTSCWPTGRSSPQTRIHTPTCTGPCAEEGATSAS